MSRQTLDVYGLYSKKVKQLEEDKEKFEKLKTPKVEILKTKRGKIIQSKDQKNEDFQNVFKIFGTKYFQESFNVKFVDNNKAQRQSIANHIKRIQN